MLFSNELILINNVFSFDDIGNQISEEERIEVFCNVKSITRAEFYNAATTDLKPSITFVVHLFEYNNEEKVEYEGVQYRVIRTYIANTEEIELICEKVLSDGQS